MNKLNLDKQKCDVIRFNRTIILPKLHDISYEDQQFWGYRRRKILKEYMVSSFSDHSNRN